MSITFEEEQRYAKRDITAPARGLYGLMMRWGFAKDQKQAEIALIVLAAIALLVAAGIWLLAGTSAKGPTHEELIRLQQFEGV